MLAPDWLTVRINYKSIKYIYEFKDGHAVLKGVRIGNEIAEIGDEILFDGKRLSVERRDPLSPTGRERPDKGRMMLFDCSKC